MADTDTHTHKTTRGAVRIRNEVWDASHGQLDCSILALDERGGGAGYIDYSLFDGEVHIKYIKVADDVLRQGLATKMLAALSAENPSHKINWGMTTPEGSALKRSLHRPTQS